MMIKKYLFGSKLLQLNNARDEDWLHFIDEPAKIANTLGYKSIPFYKRMINFFVTGMHVKSDHSNALIIYQLSAGFMLDKDYPFSEFNILKHTDIWKKWLKAYVNDKQIEDWATKSNILPKQYYHLLYQYYMITENTHWISETAKSQVQKIHDLEVSSSYFYELRDQINSL